MKTLLVSAILAVTAIAIDSAAPIAGRKIQMFATLDPAEDTDNAKLIKYLVDTVDQIAEEEGIENLWQPTSQKIHEHSEEWSKCPTVECQEDIMSRIMDLFNEFLLVVISEQMGVLDRIIHNVHEKCYHLDEES